MNNYNFLFSSVYLHHQVPSPLVAGEAPFDMAGAQWQGEHLLLSAWLGRFKDTWNTGYLSANYTLPLADQQSLNIDGQIYRSTDTGAALVGRINNNTSSVMLRYGEHRANAAQAELDTRQIRLALEYPIGN